MTDIRKLQHDLYEWQVRNFGVAPPYHCVLGMMEEFGHELCDEIFKFKLDGNETIWIDRVNKTDSLSRELLYKLEDAIADTGIYLLNFCSMMDIQAEDLNIEVPTAPSNKDHFIHQSVLFPFILGIAADIGTIARCILKTEQGIREINPLTINVVVASLIQSLSLMSNKLGFDFWPTVEKVAREVVLKRDWKQFPKNGVNA